MKNTKNLLGTIFAFANTLDGLYGDLYQALDVVSRELVGVIPGCTRNTSAEQAAVGQSITYPLAPAMEATDVVPTMNPTEPPNKTVPKGTMQISKSRAVEFGFVGEEQRGLNNGAGLQNTQQLMIAESLRTLVNEMETDAAIAAYTGASNAFGVPDTTPFATSVGDAAQVRKLLDDNGAPQTGRSLVINTTAGANLRSINNLTRVNEAGDSMTLRDGMLQDLSGLAVRESAQIQSHIKGDADSATTNTAGYAVGATEITLASAGTGAILANDIITFAGDSTKYQVVSGDADVSNGGTITLAKPGLKVALPASATAITVVDSSVRNVAFSSNAIQLVTRAPERPVEGDLALDVGLITDPRTGMVFEVSIYPGERKVKYQIAIAWGVDAIKSEHIVGLLG